MLSSFTAVFKLWFSFCVKMSLWLIVMLKDTKACSFLPYSGALLHPDLNLGQKLTQRCMYV